MFATEFSLLRRAFTESKLQQRQLACGRVGCDAEGGHTGRGDSDGRCGLVHRHQDCCHIAAGWAAGHACYRPGAEHRGSCHQVAN